MVPMMTRRRTEEADTTKHLSLRLRFPLTGLDNLIVLLAAADSIGARDALVVARPHVQSPFSCNQSPDWLHAAFSRDRGERAMSSIFRRSKRDWCMVSEYFDCIFIPWHFWRLSFLGIQYLSYSFLHNGIREEWDII